MNKNIDARRNIKKVRKYISFISPEGTAPVNMSGNTCSSAHNKAIKIALGTTKENMAILLILILLDVSVYI